MGSLPEPPAALIAMLGRRRARRIPLPVDIELCLNDITVAAVVRDVSFGEEQDAAVIGVGLFHTEALPLNEVLCCRTLSPTRVLPEDSTVVLCWTRQFGGDGYLSGGRMRKCALLPDGNDDLVPCTAESGSFDKQRTP